MKLLTLLLLSFLSFEISASSVLYPFREGTSNYVDDKTMEKSWKYFRTSAPEVLAKGKEAVEAHLGGSLEDIIEELHSVTASSGRNERVRIGHLLNVLRQQNAIDDILYRLLRDTMEAKFPTASELENDHQNSGPALTLEEYLRKKAWLVKASTAASEPVSNPFPKNKFSFTALKKRNLSAQEMIFYTYRPNQIRSLSNIMAFTLNVADAESVVTTVTFRDSSAQPLVLAHTAADQYRLALRLMKQKKSEAEREVSQIGRPVKNIDLIISAYLLGVISSDELALIVNDANFYLPEVAMEKKVLKFLGNLALLGLKLHPVTAPYVIVPLIIYNAYTETKDAKHRVDEDSFLFTLPGERK